MMKKLIFIALLLVPSLIQGQQKKPNYQFSQDVFKNIETDTTAWRYQMGATVLSFNGYHEDALAVWLKNGARKPPREKLDSLFYEQSKKIDAKAYIIERAKKEEIIIINEAHHNPMHRVFTASLLSDLYDNGYRYLGLEALADSAINERKYATQQSGYYTKEPAFGNLIAEALKLGFKIFGYEASNGANGKEREIEQAKNIERFVRNHPKGKLLVHCGFSHVFENDYPLWEKAMAGRVKEYLNIDPFTIDQELYTERGESDYSPLFVNLNTSDKPIVLLDPKGAVFAGARKPNQTDIVVIHPMTQYLNNRPGWITKGRKPVVVNTQNFKLPVLALAFRANEDITTGVPADLVEITAGRKAPLYLKPGRYCIVIQDRSYKQVSSYLVELK